MSSAIKLKKRKKLIVGISLFCLFFSIIYSSTQTNFQELAQKKVLENGLTFIYQIDKTSPLTVIQILIKGGKRAEPLEKDGLAYLTSRLTVEIPDRGKIQDMMTQATHLSMNCRKDYSLVRISCLSEYLEETLELVTGIMQHPLFSGIRINHIKKMMENYKKAEQDDAIKVAHNTFSNLFFHHTPYAGSLFGNEKSLKAIKKKDIVNFYQEYFKAGNMVVSVSTDLEEGRILKVIDQYFKKFPSGEASEIKPFSFVHPEKKVYSLEKDTQQCLVSLGYPLPKITPKNYVQGLMLENLLGKGFNSRLWPLRIEKKLAYNVNSNLTMLKQGGMIEAYLETDQTKKDKALNSLQGILHLLYQEGVTEEELETTKVYTKASFLRGIETKENRTHILASFEALGLGYEFLYRIPQEIEKIEVEEFNTFLKNYLDPQKEIQVIIGPELNPKI